MRVLSLVPGLDPARGGMASAATNMLLAGRKAGVDSVVAIPEHGSRETASRALVDLLEQAGWSCTPCPSCRGRLGRRTGGASAPLRPCGRRATSLTSTWSTYTGCGYRPAQWPGGRTDGWQAGRRDRA